MAWHKNEAQEVLCIFYQNTEDDWRETKSGCFVVWRKIDFMHSAQPFDIPTRDSRKWRLLADERKLYIRIEGHIKAQFERDSESL